MRGKWLISWTCISADGSQNFGNDVIGTEPLVHLKVMRKTLPESRYTILFAMKVPKGAKLEDDE